MKETMLSYFCNYLFAGTSIGCIRNSQIIAYLLSPSRLLILLQLSLLSLPQPPFIDFLPSKPTPPFSISLYYLLFQVITLYLGNFVSNSIREVCEHSGRLKICPTPQAPHFYPQRFLTYIVRN